MLCSGSVASVLGVESQTGVSYVYITRMETAIPSVNYYSRSMASTVAKLSGT